MKKNRSFNRDCLAPKLLLFAQLVAASLFAIASTQSINAVQSELDICALVDFADRRQQAIKIPADLITINTRLEHAVGEYERLNRSGAVSLDECARSCCQKVSCNYAYLKEVHECYLLTCLSDEQCKLTANAPSATSNGEALDYMIRIRSVEQSNRLIEQFLQKEKSDLLAVNRLIDAVAGKHATYKETSDEADGRECLPSESGSCPANEKCLYDAQHDRYACVCPLDESMLRIDAQCREYLNDARTCTLSDDCEQQTNEQECVFVQEANVHSKLGRCQCKPGYRRNMNTMLCERTASAIQQYEIVTDDEKKALANAGATQIAVETKQMLKEQVNTRRRPAPSQLAKKEEQSNSLLQSNKLNAKDLIKNMFYNPIDLSKTTTTRTTTTAASKTTKEIEPIYTADLMANAGHDMHIYYPTRVCILNGTLSKYAGETAERRIVKWLWTKDLSSPAFGQFVNKNDGPIVLYENLIEGVYKFVLQIWTNTNEFSQSIVKVYVHSSSSPFSASLAFNRKNATSETKQNGVKYAPFNRDTLADNLIQFELDMRPNRFTDASRSEFLLKFELLLKQQFRLVNPRVFVVNTRIAQDRGDKQANVLLELVISDSSGDDALLQQATIDFDEDLFVQSDVEAIARTRQLVRSDFIVRELRRKQKMLKFDLINTSINSMLKQFSLESYSDYFSRLVERVTGANMSDGERRAGMAQLNDFFQIEIVSSSQVTCFMQADAFESNTDRTNARKSGRSNCSNRGQCDLYTRKCICDRYYMPNIFLKYYNYESDLTDANNCDLYIPGLILILVFACAILSALLYCALKFFYYILYYSFCCCCCRRKNSHFKKRKLKANSSTNDERFLLYSKNSEPSDEDFDSDNQFITNKGKNQRGLLRHFKFSSSSSASKKNSLRKVPGSNDSSGGGKTRPIKYSLLRDDQDMNDQENSLLNGDETSTKLNLDQEEEEDVVFDRKIASNSTNYKNKSSENRPNRGKKQTDTAKIKTYSNII